jgi:hypothetical protein
MRLSFRAIHCPSLLKFGKHGRADGYPYKNPLILLLFICWVWIYTVAKQRLLLLLLTLKADLILLDETDARQVAATFSLKKTGVIGILIKARAEGKIGSLRLELNPLIDTMGFFIDDRLYHQALFLSR